MQTQFLVEALTLYQIFVSDLSDCRRAGRLLDYKKLSLIFILGLIGMYCFINKIVLKEAL